MHVIRKDEIQHREEKNVDIIKQIARIKYRRVGGGTRLSNKRKRDQSDGTRR